MIFNGTLTVLAVTILSLSFFLAGITYQQNRSVKPPSFEQLTCEVISENPPDLDAPGSATWGLYAYCRDTYIK
jgi:hypothetical protein